MQLCCVQLIQKKPSDNVGEDRRPAQKVNEKVAVKAAVILKGDEVEYIESTLAAPGVCVCWEGGSLV